MSKIYECKQPVELSKKDFERINKLFKVDFEEETPEMEALINEIDARPDTNPATFWWEFEDGATIAIDIQSNKSCYTDIVIYSSNTEEYMLESDYQICEVMDMEINKELHYICRIKIIEEV